MKIRPFGTRLGCILFALAGTPSCSRKTQTQDAKSLSSAPPFAGTTLDGDHFQLEGMRGTTVLLNIWATWCTPCREELPELAAIHRHYQDRNFSVVGVSVDTASARPQLQSMVDEFSLPYPTVFDPQATILPAFAVSGFPTSFIIDAQGRILWRRNGLIHNGDKELTAAIERALKPKTGND